MTSIITIKILNEIHAVIIGLPQKHITYFYDKFGIYAHGYFFNPQYKLKRWDGKNRFFTKQGKTSINLLDSIIPDLKEMGYKINLIDKRTVIPCITTPIDKHYFDTVTLGPHQVEAANHVFSNDGGIIVAGTGAGKTILTAVICDVYEKKCNYKSIIIVPNTDLISQTIDELKLIANLDVGEYSGNCKDLDHKHIVSTWQALQNNPLIIAQYNVVIIDECHGAKGSVLKSLLENYAINSSIRIGLTGTMPEHEADRVAVKYVLGNVLYTIPASELIESGWLAKLNIKCLSLIESFKNEWESYQLSNPKDALATTYKKFKSSYFPDYTAECAYLKTKKSRLAFLSDYITTISEINGNCFCLVSNIDIGKKLTKLINGSFFVYGKDERHVRNEIYRLFDEHDNIVVISTYSLASTGLNIKRIFNLFMIDSGKSFIKIIQSIGRALRKAHDKDAVIVYDIHSDTKYSKRHAAKRKQHYESQKYEYTIKNIKYEELLDN